MVGRQCGREHLGPALPALPLVRDPRFGWARDEAGDDSGAVAVPPVVVGLGPQRVAVKGIGGVVLMRWRELAKGFGECPMTGGGVDCEVTAVVRVEQVVLSQAEMEQAELLVRSAWLRSHDEAGQAGKHVTEVAERLRAAKPSRRGRGQCDGQNRPDAGDCQDGEDGAELSLPALAVACAGDKELAVVELGEPGPHAVGQVGRVEQWVHRPFGEQVSVQPTAACLSHQQRDVLGGHASFLKVGLQQRVTRLLDVDLPSTGRKDRSWPRGQHEPHRSARAFTQVLSRSEGLPDRLLGDYRELIQRRRSRPGPVRRRAVGTTARRRVGAGR